MLNFKKLFIFLLAVSLSFPFELNRSEAASAKLNKTVEIFIGQDGAVRNSGAQFPLSYPFTVSLPESAIVIKSAIIEISGVSYNDTGDQTIAADLQPGGAVKSHIVPGGSNKPGFFSFKYDATSVINILNPNYTFNLAGSVAGGNYSFSLSSAKMILSYDYLSSSSNILKKTALFVGQEKDPIIKPAAISKNFTVTIPEPSPEIKSVFIEISGSAKGSGTGTFQAGIAPVDSGEIYDNTYSLDLGGAPNSISKFVLRHDAFSKITFASPDSKNYTLYFKSNDFDISLWSAKLIITYKYSLGGMPVKGEVTSSIFDTGRINGVAFNSLSWKGFANGGQVRFQFASSDALAGPWTNADFKGPDCTSNTYYDAAADAPVEIICASDNNKRYFRYKVIICSNDCTNKGTSTPEVSDIVINWAP